MKLRDLLVTASMLFTLTAVHAEDAKLGPAMNHGEMRKEMKQRCDANPEKCAEMKERMKKEHEEIKAACAKEPARCKEIRQEHRQKWCADNPEQCAKIKARREEMQKQCAADPKACEARKAEMREKMKERMEQRHEQGMGPHDGMPMSPMHDGAMPDKK
ncbi:MAG: hypothetical protein WAX67_09490 [Rugosibacter sp.]